MNIGHILSLNSTLDCSPKHYFGILENYYFFFLKLMSIIVTPIFMTLTNSQHSLLNANTKSEILFFDGKHFVDNFDMPRKRKSSRAHSSWLYSNREDYVNSRIRRADRGPYWLDLLNDKRILGLLIP